MILWVILNRMELGMFCSGAFLQTTRSGQGAASHVYRINRRLVASRNVGAGSGDAFSEERQLLWSLWVVVETQTPWGHDFFGARPCSLLAGCRPGVVEGRRRELSVRQARALEAA
jgi:hypothetical protein